MRVEPNRDVIWSRDIGDCGPVSSMAALPAGSACMMLPNYGDHGTTAFIPTRAALDRVNRLLFGLSGLPPDGQPAWLVFSDDDSFFNLPRHVAAGVGLANDTGFR